MAQSLIVCFFGLVDRQDVVTACHKFGTGPGTLSYCTTRELKQGATAVTNARNTILSTERIDSQEGSCVLGAHIAYAMAFIAFLEERAGMTSSLL